ncbi:MAG: hypothetical protein IPP29_18330 [Bacteroidetes bacterium]|nr:hypothetical protein [Bacteroidota bacterium]
MFSTLITAMINSTFDIIIFCHLVFLTLAPDHKIYVSMWYIWDSLQFPFPYPDSVFVTQNTYLGVINSPDSPSTSCNFPTLSYYLRWRTCRT